MFFVCSTIVFNDLLKEIWSYGHFFDKLYKNTYVKLLNKFELIFKNFVEWGSDILQKNMHLFLCQSTKKIIQNKRFLIEEKKLK